MTKTEALQIIEAIRQSVDKERDQFHLTVQVNAIGFQSISQGGGIGAHISAVGGGLGSSAVGLHATAGGGNIEVQLVKGKADQETKEKLDWLVKTLGEILDELNTSHPNKSKLDGLLDSIRGTWVPGVICSVIGNVITMTWTALTHS